MNTKIKIKRIARKEIDTQYGKKWKIGVQDEQGAWYNTWAGAWNQGWKEGQVVEFEYEENQYGKQIKAPKKEFSGGGNTGLAQDIAEMKGMLRDILKAIARLDPGDYSQLDMGADPDDSVPF